MELQQVVFRHDFQPLAKLRHGDSKQRWNGRIFSGIEQIHRTWQALAIRQRVEGLAVFGGGHDAREFRPKASQAAIGFRSFQKGRGSRHCRRGLS
jgi:hypothetical protein